MGKPLESLTKALDVIASLPPTPKQPPLSERVTWTPSCTGLIHQADAAGICVTIWPHRDGSFIFTSSFGTDGWRRLESPDLKAAKLEALRIVQRAVLDAADVWCD